MIIMEFQRDPNIPTQLIFECEGELIGSVVEWLGTQYGVEDGECQAGALLELLLGEVARREGRGEKVVVLLLLILAARMEALWIGTPVHVYRDHVGAAWTPRFPRSG